MMAAGILVLAAVLAGTAEVRVLTYNIHHAEGTDGRLDVERIARVIRAAAPDVVCLQEVDRNLPRTDRLDLPALLAEQLGMEVRFGANYLFDRGEYGNATLTRLPIVRHDNVSLPNPLQKEPRGCLRTVVQVDGQEVEIWNTHLGLEREERRQQAEKLVLLLRPVPTVLAGDLNENEQAPGVALLMSHLQDTAPEGGPPVLTSPASNPRRRIDFVLASRHFKSAGGAVHGTEETAVASDHMPYVVVLTLAPREQAP
jgi:endonuclease/exonuclease/phosphatase family metal-dependent hydrolase